MTENKPQIEAEKKNGGQIFLEEITRKTPGQPSRWRQVVRSLTVPALAILTGLIIGGLIIVLTTEDFYKVLRQDGVLPGLKVAYETLKLAYSSLFNGAFGDPARMQAALQSGNAEEMRRAFAPFFESLVATTPYIFGGLSVALGFRAGLFNIGAEGQIFIGAIFCSLCRVRHYWFAGFYSPASGFPGWRLGRRNLGFYPRMVEGENGRS